MNEFSVLIIEDEPEICYSFSKLAKEYNELSICGITNSSYEGINIVKKYTPDVVILDLELHNGFGSGIEFLQGLKDIGQHPYILVTTNNSSSITFDIVRNLGADFIMYKHEKDYSERKVFSILLSIKHIIVKKREENQYHSDSPYSVSFHNTNIDAAIIEEFNYIGVPIKSLGYNYLKDAIKLVIDGSRSGLCNKIGQKYGKSPVSVERAMQHAIQKTWTSANIDDLTKYFELKYNPEKSSPTITEFVYFYADKISNKFT